MLAGRDRQQPAQMGGGFGSPTQWPVSIVLYGREIWRFHEDKRRGEAACKADRKTEFVSIASFCRDKFVGYSALKVIDIIGVSRYTVYSVRERRRSS